MIQHTLSVTDCTTQRISLFSDGKSVLYWRQGVYHVVLSVHDHTPYALFSTSYTIGVLRPNQLELSCNGKVENGMAVDHKMLLATPLQLSLPSSVHPQSIRWIVDDTPLATTTPSLRLSQDVLDSTKEKHVVYAFVYTDDARAPRVLNVLVLLLPLGRDSNNSSPHEAHCATDDSTPCGTDGSAQERGRNHLLRKRRVRRSGDL